MTVCKKILFPFLIAGAVAAIALMSSASAGVIAVPTAQFEVQSTRNSAEDEDTAGVESTDSENPATAAYAFINMPRQYLDILTVSMRKDMVIYMEADSVLKHLNVYMGESWIEKMTRDYIKVHLTNASNIQIKSLPAKDGKPLFISIYTVTADNSTSDSTIKFFNYDMQELPTAKYFKLPDPIKFYDFPKSLSGREKDEILALMPFYTVEYNISPDSNILKGTLTISDYLTLENMKRVEKYLSPDKSWAWDGKKFKEL